MLAQPTFPVSADDKQMIAGVHKCFEFLDQRLFATSLENY